MTSHISRQEIRDTLNRCEKAIGALKSEKEKLEKTLRNVENTRARAVDQRMLFSTDYMLTMAMRRRSLLMGGAD